MDSWGMMDCKPARQSFGADTSGYAFQPERGANERDLKTVEPDPTGDLSPLDTNVVKEEMEDKKKGIDLNSSDTLCKPVDGTKNESLTDDTITASDLETRTAERLNGDDFKHFHSEAERLRNKEVVEDYAQKKMLADLTMLKTQQDTLAKYGHYMDQENLKRMERNIGTNQIEVVDSIYFENELLKGASNDIKPYITGFQDVLDGKICIRDSTDPKRIEQTAAHETMHDLSYHHRERWAEVAPDANETVEHERLRSGLNIFDITTRYENGTMIGTHIEKYGTALNEGITQAFTIDSLQRRGIEPSFDSYSQEVTWGRQLKYAIGSDDVERAYFGGDIQTLKARVNALGGDPATWDMLNAHMDAYARENDERIRNTHRNDAQTIMNQLLKNADMERWG